MWIEESQIGQSLGLYKYWRKYTRQNEIALDSSTGIFSRINYKNISPLIDEFTINQNSLGRKVWDNEDVFYGTNNLVLLTITGSSLWNIGSELTDYFGWNFNVGEHHWCFAFDSLNGYYNSFIIYRSDKKQEKGNLIGTVESSSPDTYPENGIGADGYWYVRQT